MVTVAYLVIMKIAVLHFILRVIRYFVWLGMNKMQQHNASPHLFSPLPSLFSRCLVQYFLKLLIAEESSYLNT